jgi:hypothetical protein
MTLLVKGIVIGTCVAMVPAVWVLTLDGYFERSTPPIRSSLMFSYNGGMLVMSETRHGNEWAVRRRLKALDDGRTLTVEVIYLAPAQKTETLTFTRRSAKSGGV